MSGNRQQTRLRLLFVLVILFVGSDSWSGIFKHQGAWDPVRAAAVCMWAAFSGLAILALINPLRWLPIVAFEIFYKIIWLVMVAYPLWSSNQLAGSPAAEMAFAFYFVLLPILAMPWGASEPCQLCGRAVPVLYIKGPWWGPSADSWRCGNDGGRTEVL